MHVSTVNGFLNSKKHKKSFKSSQRVSNNNYVPRMSGSKHPRIPQNKSFWESDFLYWTTIAYILAGAPIANKLSNISIDKEVKRYEISSPKNDDLKILIDNPDYPNAVYQLSKLNDIDKPDVKCVSKDIYLANLKLDGKNFVITMFTDNLDDNEISGDVVIDGTEKFRYKAFLNHNDVKTVEVEFSCKENENGEKNNIKKVFLREPDGELCIVENGKKTVLNRNAVESFKKVRELYHSKIELNKDFAFYQNILYILGICLTIARINSRIYEDNDKLRKLHI